MWDFLERRRAAWPWFDHLVRAALRYRRDGGDRLAAGLTYYGFLSVLPLLLLAISVLGYALEHNPELQARILTSLGDALPGVGATLTENLTEVQQHRRATGLLGLAGLLYAGFGGVDATRASLRVMWHQDPGVGNLARTKLHDLLTLAGLGAVLLASFAVTAIGAGALSGRFGGLADRLVALVLGLAADTALFVYLFRRLPRIDWPWRRVLRGALFGAVGFTVLKAVATSYVGQTTTRSTELYGALGAVIGVLVGINLIARLVMFTAAWTVTEPGSDDVLPSATGEDLTQSPDDPRGRRDRVPRAVDRVGAAPARPRGAGAEPGPGGESVHARSGRDARDR